MLYAKFPSVPVVAMKNTTDTKAFITNAIVTFIDRVSSNASIELTAPATFKKANGECIKATMDRSERSTLEDFKKELTNLSKGNKKVAVKLSDLEAYKNTNADVVLKKSRTCAMKARKSISKKDKKLMRSAMSKMKIADIINL